MKWHYLKNEGYPKWYAEIIVKCEDGEYWDRSYPHEIPWKENKP